MRDFEIMDKDGDRVLVKEPLEGDGPGVIAVLRTLHHDDDDEEYGSQFVYLNEHDAIFLAENLLCRVRKARKGRASVHTCT